MREESGNENQRCDSDSTVSSEELHSREIDIEGVGIFLTINAVQGAFFREEKRITSNKKTLLSENCRKTVRNVLFGLAGK